MTVLFATRSEPLRGAEFTLGHDGTSHVLVTGLAPGTYAAVRDGEVVAPALEASLEGGTVDFETASGQIRIRPADTEIRE